MVSPAAASNHDPITNNLSWLSSNSLAQFMTSIKGWLSFESGPAAATEDAPTCSGFILRLNSRWTSTYTSCSLCGISPLPLPDPSLSFINSRLCPTDPSPTFREPDPRFKILSSSNGLILCSKVVRPSCTFPRTSSFISCVCNPSTEYYKAIPQPGASYVIGSGLAFDPSISPHYQVVCFSPVSDILFQTSYDIELEIYSSETGMWESGGQSWLQDGIFDGNGVYWGGTINWVNYEGSLVSFDMERKQLEIGACPERFGGDILYFGESSGKLHLISTEGRAGQHYDVGAACFDIMDMVEGRSGWRLIYHVDLRGMEVLYPGVYVEKTDANGQNVKKLDVWPVYVVRGEGEEEEEEVVMSMRREIVAYGLKNKTFRRVCVVTPSAAAAAEGGVNQALRARDVTPYALTLASV